MISVVRRCSQGVCQDLVNLRGRVQVYDSFRSDTSGKKERRKVDNNRKGDNENGTGKTNVKILKSASRIG